MIDNPFSTIERRLNRLEFLTLEIKEILNSIPSPAADKLLSVTEAAEFLNLAVPTVYGMVSRRELPHIKKSKRLYFSKQELTNWLKSGRKSTVSEMQEEAAGKILIQSKAKGGRK